MHEALFLKKTFPSNTMNFRTVVAILKWITVVILVIVYYQFFFKGVINQYGEGLTNMATMEQDLEKDEVGIKAPALIICMKPSWKMEVLKKYNITNQFFMLRNGSFEHLNGKKTMKEIINEASFRMNEDFSIALTTYQNPMEDFSVVLNIGTNTFTRNGNEFSINVTDVYSIQKGMCYIVQSNLYIATQYSYILSVILRNDNVTQKPNQLQLTATSDDDALGITIGLWGKVEPMTLPNIPFDNKTTIIDLRETIKTRILNCNKNDTPFQKCLAEGFKELVSSSDCPVKCKPMLAKSFYDKYIGDGERPPDCDNLENERCVVRGGEKVFLSISQCKSQCIVKEYSSKPVITDHVNPSCLEDGERTDIFLLSSVRTRTLVKEYEVYDTAGMIGTVGGSLGLFLGLSFYGVFSDVLDLLVKKITKQD